MNIAAAMATLKYARDVDFTARAVLLALACHASHEESVAKVRITDVADELGITRGNVLRAVRRAEKAGHLSVEKVGYTGRPWHISVAPARSNETELSARARSMAEKAARHRDNGARHRAPIKRIFGFKDLESVDASLADTASVAAVVDDGPAPAKTTPRRAGIPPGLASAARDELAAARRRLVE